MASLSKTEEVNAKSVRSAVESVLAYARRFGCAGELAIVVGAFVVAHRAMGFTKGDAIEGIDEIWAEFDKAEARRKAVSS